MALLHWKPVELWDNSLYALITQVRTYNMSSSQDTKVDINKQTEIYWYGILYSTITKFLPCLWKVSQSWIFCFKVNKILEMIPNLQWALY